MPETLDTTESDSAPFKTYRESLRRAKEEAAEARKTAEDLDTEVRTTAEDLDAEVRKVSAALDKLEETIPEWWQTWELTTREISYQPFRMWRKEASEILESAQDDFGSGKISRIEEGVEKTKRARSNLNKKIKSIKEDIREERSKIEKMRNKVNRIGADIDDVEDDYDEMKSTAVLLANIWGGAASLIGFLGGCLVGMDTGSPFGTGIVGAFIVGLLVWTILYLSMVLIDGKSERRKIGNLKENQSEIDNSIKESKEKLNRLKKYRKSISIAGNGSDAKQTQIEVLYSNPSEIGSN